MDRVIEEGRQQHEEAKSTIESLHSQLDRVKQQTVEQLRRAVETRVRTSETRVRDLAIEVATVRDLIDSLGVRRYGGAWSNVTGRAPSKRATNAARTL